MTNSTVEGNDELHAAGNDVVGGGAGSDTLDGGDDNDALTGGDGTDDLLGGAGVDALNGEAGLDLLDGGAGADILNGGADADAADYSASPAAVLVNMGNQSQNAGGFAAGDSLADMEVLLGSAFNDALFGDAVVNRLEGQAGNDTMDGGAGTDMLLGGAGSDNLQTGSGLTDQLQGGDDADASSSMVVALLQAPLSSSPRPATIGCQAERAPTTLTLIEGSTGSPIGTMESRSTSTSCRPPDRLLPQSSRVAVAFGSRGSSASTAPRS
ncbi:MAG: calcium-binding protein [Rhodoplanes sp.]